ncbi:GIY-YIG nuclease family protein [Abyssalbus ytuae]|uniref:GIY-YIG nuclease family protein n=1 Tax=Abyssalbus ytuae TaxID=2926907 RepID=A0A9E6ZTB6_9FLAO|nr:GIY-YIG nuclease family protein [Abyssalbus ytuae]UOB18483.1 GIY-YIG nuclease family protein [Abyssalbus ytuae]
MHFVYIIYSHKFARFYVGMSQDVKERLRQHNSGTVKSTKAFLPWVVCYQEVFETIEEARKREKYLKSAAGRRWRKNNIERPRSSTG